MWEILGDMVPILLEPSAPVVQLPKRVGKPSCRIAGFVKQTILWPLDLDEVPTEPWRIVTAECEVRNVLTPESEFGIDDIVLRQPHRDEGRISHHVLMEVLFGCPCAFHELDELAPNLIDRHFSRHSTDAPLLAVLLLLAIPAPRRSWSHALVSSRSLSRGWV